MVIIRLGETLISKIDRQNLEEGYALITHYAQSGQFGKKSLRFYCDVLGMKLLRQKDYPDGKFTLAFVGYGDESDSSTIELTYNWGVEGYTSRRCLRSHRDRSR